MKLKNWRAKHDLTQDQTAVHLGMHRRGIQVTEKLPHQKETITLATLYLDLMLSPTAEQAAYLLRKYRKTWNQKKDKKTVD